MEPRDLYGLPLDRFVAERGALAKSLRADGKRDEAAEVAKLRKPSVAAWAVNQLVRTQSREVKALFKAGDQLQRAQADLLAGKGDAGKLRAAAEREREAVDELTEAARGLLSSEGHELAQATLDRVSDTLHAAALDEDARGEVQDGCLVRELRHVGLGAFGELPASPAPRERETRIAMRSAGRLRRQRRKPPRPRARRPRGRDRPGPPGPRRRRPARGRGRARRGRRARRGSGQRACTRRGAAQAPVAPNSSSSMSIRPTGSNPSRSRIGRDIAPACVISAGSPCTAASCQRA